MSGRVEIAEEVTQEVFLALITRPRAFREAAGALQGFLIGIARNKLRRYLSAYGRPEAGSNAAIEPDFELPAADPFEVAELRAAILSLPRRYREVVVLCELDEMSYEAAARSLGCAVGTVRSRLHRARQILSAKLRKDLEGRRYKRCAVY
jgi:RNA polymerase sigma-70 factor (ECF subfamily)